MWMSQSEKDGVHFSRFNVHMTGTVFCPFLLLARRSVYNWGGSPAAEAHT